MICFIESLFSNFSKRKKFYLLSNVEISIYLVCQPLPAELSCRDRAFPGDAVSFLLCKKNNRGAKTCQEMLMTMAFLAAFVLKPSQRYLAPGGDSQSKLFWEGKGKG